MDDDDLVARVAAGDDTALRELFGRHAPWLAVRLRAVLPADDVEDVLQETFLAAWRGARGYQPQGACGGWLWGIARRQAALLLRRRGHSKPAEQAGAALLAGLLHDLGKIAIADRILQKPGKLDPDELRIMREHPELGVDVVVGEEISTLDGHLIGLYLSEAVPAGPDEQTSLARRLGYEEYPRQAFIDDYLRITRRCRRAMERVFQEELA